MIWIIGIIIVFVLIFAISSSGSKIADAQANAELENRMVSRIEAYRDFIRREGGKPEWEKMTDNELEDQIASAIRNYNKSHDGVGFISRIIFVVGCAATVAGALFFFTKNFIDEYGAGTSTLILLGIGVGGGVIIAWVLSNLFRKKIDNDFINRGWDIEKLGI